MTKTVQEKEYKFFSRYSDALSNENYWMEIVELEGYLPPSRVQSKIFREEFELRLFTRQNGPDKYFENVYLISREI